MREHWTQKRMQELTEENLRLLEEKSQMTKENARLRSLLAEHNITIDENSL